jgi:ubiquinone/menaquinone biosynthesis C-methylase UbiE
MTAVSEQTQRYYQLRALEYDETAWASPDADASARDEVREVLASLVPTHTLDVGCGTGYVSRWLPGPVTLLDSSRAMLTIAARRLPRSARVLARAPDLPFSDAAFGRAFAANLYGHLHRAERAELLRAMLRVAGEVVLLEQLVEEGAFREGPELRRLRDGTAFTIHKCYFTVERLLEEVGGGQVLMRGPAFAIVRRQQ